MSTPEAPLYDLVGVGFGPANVALAGALIEKWDDPSTSNDAVPRKVLFLEKQETFRWHPGMLLPHARMQISFLKDLATLRNPSSPITFLNYLHAHGRLVQFINRGENAPSRREFSDYLGWVARYVQNRGAEVQFSKEVMSIADGADGLAHIHFRDTVTGEVSVVRAKNLVLSPGGRKNMPAPLLALDHDEHVLHSSAYATSIGPIISRLASTPRPLRVAVIGAGQSSSEVLMDLHERLSAIPAAGGRHQLDMLFRKGSIKPSDDSPFANEIFDPSSTDMIYNLPSRRARRQVIAEYKSTNYSVTNPRTIDNFYEIMYAQGVEEDIAAREQRQLTTPFINLCPYTYIVSASCARPHAPVELALHDVLGRSALRTETYDVVVCGTGYDRTAWLEMLALGGLGARFGLENKSGLRDVQIVPVEEAMSRPISPDAVSRSSSLSSGTASDFDVSVDKPAPQRLHVSRAYRAMPVDDAPAPRVYLQGCLEQTHGLSDTLLSVMGVKSGEIVDDLMRA